MLFVKNFDNVDINPYPEEQGVGNRGSVQGVGYLGTVQGVGNRGNAPSCAFMSLYHSQSLTIPCSMHTVHCTLHPVQLTQCTLESSEKSFKCLYILSVGLGPLVTQHTGRPASS